MTVRTFYWDPGTPLGLRSKLRRKLKRQAPTWQHGNAGDLFNVDLVDWAYPGHGVANVVEEGRRLLLVGSIAGRLQPGDLVCGIGSKKPSVPAMPDGSVTVRGVRGPLTLEAFESAGHDVSDVHFMGDPGLLIGRMFPDVLEIEAEPNRVIFIPHYRQRPQYTTSPDYEVVDIDATPREIAVAIRRAEFVHTSSLHGLIWAHALGRPTQLVTPPAEESQFKYQDYLSSVGLASTQAVTIEESIRTAPSIGVHDVTSVIDSIVLPALSELTDQGIVT